MKLFAVAYNVGYTDKNNRQMVILCSTVVADKSKKIAIEKTMESILEEYPSPKYCNHNVSVTEIPQSAINALKTQP